MNDSGVQEVYVYEGMRLVPETRLLLWAEKLAAAEAKAATDNRTIAKAGAERGASGRDTGPSP